MHTDCKECSFHKYQILGNRYVNFSLFSYPPKAIIRVLERYNREGLLKQSKFTSGNSKAPYNTRKHIQRTTVSTNLPFLKEENQLIFLRLRNGGAAVVVVGGHRSHQHGGVVRHVPESQPQILSSVRNGGEAKSFQSSAVVHNPAELEETGRRCRRRGRGSRRRGGGGGRVDAATGGGDDRGLRLAEKPLDSLPVGLMAEFPRQLEDPRRADRRQPHSPPPPVHLRMTIPRRSAVALLPAGASRFGHLLLHLEGHGGDGAGGGRMGWAVDQKVRRRRRWRRRRRRGRHEGEGSGAGHGEGFGGEIAGVVEEEEI